MSGYEAQPPLDWPLCGRDLRQVLAGSTQCGFGAERLLSRHCRRSTKLVVSFLVLPLRTQGSLARHHLQPGIVGAFGGGGFPVFACFVA
jgi:hypothetical protein